MHVSMNQIAFMSIITLNLEHMSIQACAHFTPLTAVSVCRLRSLVCVVTRSSQIFLFMLKTDRLYIATLLQAAGDGTNTANQCIHWPVSSIKGL